MPPNEPQASGFSMCGTYFPPGLFRFVGYGEPGTIMEGCPIFEPRIVEWEPDEAPLVALLEKLEKR